MNISKENIDALNAVVTIDIEKADYEPKVEEALKNYRKKASMPGFRPGHVPAGMIKRMYGKSAVAEEVNKLISDSLSKYIADNNINILGEPLPSEDMTPIDFDKDETFKVKFDLGLAPEVNLELNNKIELTYYNVEITDADVENQMKSITSRFGKHETVDKVGDNSLIKGNLTGEYNNEKAIISTAVIKDAAEKKKFVGKKVGDTVKFDVKKALPNDTELSYLLNISKEEAEKVSGEYSLEIAEITEFKEAELTQEIFDQVYGEGVVKNADEFKEKSKESIKTVNNIEEEYRFELDTKKKLLDMLKLELPEAFLKRWLTVVNHDNEKFTPDVLENEFPRFVDDLKWQVVSNDIIRKNDLKVDGDALKAYAKKAARSQFMQYGLAAIPEQYLENYAENMLKDKKQREHIVEGAASDVVANFIKTKVKIKEKTVSRDEFNKLFEA
ncbi:MAG: trigger factor [Bacteroidales bacterium]|nr:trigger factor [Bacteroidales bacterium]